MLNNILIILKSQGAAALSKHWALPCAQCRRVLRRILSPDRPAAGIRHNDATLKSLPSYRGATRHRFALLGSAIVFLSNGQASFVVFLGHESPVRSPGAQIAATDVRPP